MTQIVTPLQLIPFSDSTDAANDDAPADDGLKASYIFEPEEEEILAELLPLNINTQISKLCSKAPLPNMARG